MTYHRLRRILRGRDTLRGGVELAAIGSLAPRGGERGQRRFQNGEPLPDILEGHFVQHQCPAHAGADLSGARPHHHHALGTPASPEQARAIEFAQRFAHGGSIDAELARQLELGRQVIAHLKTAGDDVLDQRAGHAAVSGLDGDRLEQQIHAVMRNSSRPMSMRRISWVPAPIS